MKKNKPEKCSLILKPKKKRIFEKSSFNFAEAQFRSFPVTKSTIGDKQVVITREEISKRVREIALKLNKDYKNKELVFIVILKGALFFAADLLKLLSFPVIMDFIAISSYGNSTQTSGVVKIIKDLEENIAGKDCLIVEDIVDTGLTLSYLRRILNLRKPKSLKVCVFLNKKDRRIVKDIKPDYTGFVVPDEFLVGYGLDYQGLFRHYPYIFVLKEEK